MKSIKKYPARIFLLCTLAISMLIIGSCSKDDDKENNQPSSPPANEVWMQGNTFNPGSITVSANTTITWRNKDSNSHTVTSNTGGQFDSGTIAGGGTYTHQFTTAGTYPYHCNFHSGMTGQVVVQ